MTFPLEGLNGNVDITFGAEDCDLNEGECENFAGTIDRTEIAFKRNFESRRTLERQRKNKVQIHV